MNAWKTAPFLLLAFCLPLAAQDDKAAPPADDPAEFKDIGWPREYKTDNHTVVVFQPQIEEWVDFKTLKMRAAVAVSETGKEEEAQYGGLFAEVTTDVDSETRQVLLTDRKANKLIFPEADEAETQRLAGIMKLALPEKQDLIVSLDRILAAVEFSEQQMRQVEASDEVPPIYVSEEPALLVMFIGEPTLEPAADTGLLVRLNTNWDVFMTTGEEPSYYLRMEESWFTTTDPKAKSWQPAAKLPDAFAKLPADDNWAETRENIPGKPAKDPVKVFYSDRPAELIVIEGKPSMAPVVGTKLMYIKNTDADLFFHTATASYYFLSSGRWFTGKSLVEGWKFAPDELPAEFAEIPEDHEKAHVLASVRGTPAASEAVIMASIPERATIKRDEATLEVDYDGEPKFAGVEGEKGDPGVEYALNSNFDVFKVGDLYYCCFQAVWYVSSTANGPWEVCDNVPAQSTRSRPEHPKHNVTYVQVYSSTPTTVETGYTSGYTGSYVVNGLVMFGLGYWIAKERYNDYYWPYWRRYHCRPCWYGYGCRATWYNGRYWRGGRRATTVPTGVPAAMRSTIPRTGGWARSAYAYGPRGSAYTRAAYNPYTNTYGRKTRVTTPYGTGTRGVVSRNGNWAKRRQIHERPRNRRRDRAARAAAARSGRQALRRPGRHRQGPRRQHLCRQGRQHPQARPRQRQLAAAQGQQLAEHRQQ
jgi:hypothetical protein